MKVFILVSWIFMFAELALAQTSGTFMVVKGQVEIIKKDGSKEKAKIGKKVIESDTIVSAKDARAKIVMADKNVINISPETKLLLEKYVFDQASGNKQVTLNVLEGKVRATVEQKYDGEKNKFNVKTPAAVAGVRGTDFLTSYSAQKREMKIVTFEGKVAVGVPGANGAIQNPVFVEPGQFSVAAPGVPPSPPAAMPKEEFQAVSEGSSADSAGGPGGPAGAESSGPAKQDEKESAGDDKKTEPAADKKSESGATGDGSGEKNSGGTEGGNKQDNNKGESAKNDGPPAKENKGNKEGAGQSDGPKQEAKASGNEGGGDKKAAAGDNKSAGDNKNAGNKNESSNAGKPDSQGSGGARSGDGSATQKEGGGGGAPTKPSASSGGGERSPSSVGGSSASGGGGPQAGNAQGGPAAAGPKGPGPTAGGSLMGPPGGGASGGSMISSRDLAPNLGSNVLPPMPPTVPVIDPSKFLPPTQVAPIPNDFINNTITTGKSRTGIILRRNN